MSDARSNSGAQISYVGRNPVPDRKAGLVQDYITIIKRRPYKAAVCIVTLVAFICNIISYDIAWGFDADTSQAKEPVVKHLNPATFTLPQHLGTIKDAWTSTHRRGQLPNKGLARPSITLGTSPEKGRRTRGEYESLPSVVIHIQDAHCNYYAQKKITEIIKYFNDEYGVNTVNLEGGAKDYDISIFTDIGDKAKREKAADYFVKEGVVNGAEYFAINNPEKVTLWGIEDVRLYIDNLKTYRNSLKYKDEVDKYLKNLSYILSNLKIKIYSKELLELDSRYNAYKVNNADFKDYLGYLMQKSKEKLIDIKSYTNIYLLSQTLGQEAEVDFRKANNERDELIDRLGKRLSKNALEELVLKTVEFKAERMSQADFYQYLANKAKSIGLELGDFPELKKYSIYIATYQAVDKARIMDEVESLEDKLKASLFMNDKDKELDILSRNLALMKNMFNISLTREDYRYYETNERSFEVRNYKRFIEREAPLYKIIAKLDENISKLDDYREDMSKFYEYSFKRDGAFMRNIRFNSSRGRLNVPYAVDNSKTAIIVTGGFHTENLTDMFKKSNISYVSIIPNFKNCDGYQCPYYNILSGEKSLRIVDALPSVLNKALAVQSEFCSAFGPGAAGGVRSAAAPAPAPSAAGVAPTRASPAVSATLDDVKMIHGKFYDGVLKIAASDISVEEKSRRTQELIEKLTNALPGRMKSLYLQSLNGFNREVEKNSKLLSQHRGREVDYLLRALSKEDKLSESAISEITELARTDASYSEAYPGIPVIAVTVALYDRLMEHKLIPANSQGVALYDLSGEKPAFILIDKKSLDGPSPVKKIAHELQHIVFKMLLKSGNIRAASLGSEEKNISFNSFRSEVASYIIDGRGIRWIDLRDLTYTEDKDVLAQAKRAKEAITLCLELSAKAGKPQSDFLYACFNSRDFDEMSDNFIKLLTRLPIRRADLVTIFFNDKSFDNAVKENIARRLNVTISEDDIRNYIFNKTSRWFYLEDAEKDIIDISEKAKKIFGVSLSAQDAVLDTCKRILPLSNDAIDYLLAQPKDISGTVRLKDFSPAALFNFFKITDNRFFNMYKEILRRDPNLRKIFIAQIEDIIRKEQSDYALDFVGDEAGLESEIVNRTMLMRRLVAESAQTSATPAPAERRYSMALSPFAVSLYTLIDNFPEMAVYFTVFSVVSLFLAILIHELSHYAAFRLFGAKKVKLNILGLRPSAQPYWGESSPSLLGDMVSTIAGIGGNLLAGTLAAFLLWNIDSISTSPLYCAFVLSFIVVNIAGIIINLLPLKEADGGIFFRMLFSSKYRQEREDRIKERDSLRHLIYVLERDMRREAGEKLPAPFAAATSGGRLNLAPLPIGDKEKAVNISPPVAQKITALIERGSIEEDNQEFGLLLFGKNGHVTECSHVFEGGGQSVAVIDPNQETADIIDKMARRGLELIAYFHTHPYGLSENEPVTEAAVWPSLGDRNGYYLAFCNDELGTEGISDTQEDMRRFWKGLHEKYTSCFTHPPLCLVGARQPDGQLLLAAHRLEWMGEGTTFYYAKPIPIMITSPAAAAGKRMGHTPGSLLGRRYMYTLSPLLEEVARMASYYYGGVIGFTIYNFIFIGAHYFRYRSEYIAKYKADHDNRAPPLRDHLIIALKTLIVPTIVTLIPTIMLSILPVASPIVLLIALFAVSWPFHISINYLNARFFGKRFTPASFGVQAPSAVNDAEELDLARLLTLLHSTDGADLSIIRIMIKEKRLSALSEKTGAAQYENFKGKIKKVREHQFSGINRPIVEIVANAIDSYNKATVGVARNVSVGIGSDGFEVSDNGRGMSFNQVLTDLLIPSRSSKREGEDGVIGRFGVGFYSALNYLHNINDSLIVETSNGKEGARVIFYVKEEDGEEVIKIKVEEVTGLPRGTAVRLSVPDGSFDVKGNEEIIRNYMKFNSNARISINGTLVNGKDLEDETLFEKISSKTSSLYCSTKKSATGRGKTYVTVNGVTIFSLDTEGKNIPSEIIICLPKETTLTKTRDRVECSAKERGYVEDLISELAKRADNILLLSAIYPVIENFQANNTEPRNNIVRDYLNRITNLLIQSDTRILPNTPEMAAIQIPSKVVFVNKNLYTHLRKFAPYFETYKDHSSDCDVYVADFNSDAIFAHYSNLLIFNRKYLPNTEVEKAVFLARLKMDGISFSFKEKAMIPHIANVSFTVHGLSQKPAKGMNTAASRHGYIESHPFLKLIFEHIYASIFSKYQQIAASMEENVDFEKLDAMVSRYLDVINMNKEEFEKASEIIDMIEMLQAKHSDIFSGLDYKMRLKFFRRVFYGNAGKGPADTDIAQKLLDAEKAYLAHAGTGRGFNTDMMFLFFLISRDDLMNKLLMDKGFMNRLDEISNALTAAGVSDGEIMNIIGYFVNKAMALEGRDKQYRFLDECINMHRKLTEGLSVGVPAGNRNTFIAKEGMISINKPLFDTIFEKTKYMLSHDTPIMPFFGKPFSDSMIDGKSGSYDGIFYKLLSDYSNILSSDEYAQDAKDAVREVFNNKVQKYRNGGIETDEFLEFMHLFTEVISSETANSNKLKPADIVKLSEGLSSFISMLKEDADKSGRPRYVMAKQIMRPGYTLEIINFFSGYGKAKYLFDFLQLISVGRFRDVPVEKMLMLWKAIIKEDVFSLSESYLDRRFFESINHIPVYRPANTKYELIVQELANSTSSRDIETMHKFARPYAFFLDSEDSALEDFVVNENSKVLTKDFFRNPHRFNLSGMVALFLNSQWADRKPEELLKMASSEDSKGYYTEIGLQTAKNSLRESINYESSDQYIFIREIIQNVLDARGKELKIEALKGDNQIILNCSDSVGMTIDEVVKFLLIPDSSSKRKDKTAIGKFGQGFFTVFKDASVVRMKTSDGGNRLTVMDFRPLRTGGLITDLEITMEVIENTENFKGTVIQWVKDTDVPELEASILKSKAVTYGCLVDPNDLNIVWSGAKEKSINRSKELFSESDTPMGKLRIYRSDQRENVITHRGLFVREIGNDIKRLLPLHLQKILFTKGVIIDLPAGVELISDRSDIANKERVLNTIKTNIVSAAFKGIMNSFARGEIGLEFFPYDIFQNSYYWERIPSDIMEDAKNLSKAKDSPVDMSRYVDDSTALSQLMMSMPFIPIKNKEGKFSLSEILIGLTSNTILFEDLPEGVSQYLRRAIGYDDRMAEQSRSLFNNVKGELSEIGDKYLDSAKPKNSLDTYWAFADFVYSISRLIIESIGARLHPLFSISYFGSAKMVLAHNIQVNFSGINIVNSIGWNLYMNEKLFESFSLYLKGELQEKELESLFLDIFSTQIHETVHVIEGTDEWTHNEEFRQCEKEMTDTLIRNIGSIKTVLEDIKNRYKGGFVPVKEFIKYLENNGNDEPRIALPKPKVLQTAAEEAEQGAVEIQKIVTDVLRYFEEIGMCNFDTETQEHIDLISSGVLYSKYIDIYEKITGLGCDKNKFKAWFHGFVEGYLMGLNLDKGLKLNERHKHILRLKDISKIEDWIPDSLEEYLNKTENEYTALSPAASAAKPAQDKAKPISDGEITYGWFDPAKEEVVIDKEKARNMLKNSGIEGAQGLPDHKLTAFVHCHEVFHELVKKLEITTIEDEEVLANQFAAFILGSRAPPKAESDIPEPLRKEIFDKITDPSLREQVFALFASPYGIDDSGAFLLALHRLHININNVRLIEQYETIPAGGKAMAADSGESDSEYFKRLNDHYGQWSHDKTRVIVKGMRERIRELWPRYRKKQQPDRSYVESFMRTIMLPNEGAAMLELLRRASNGDIRTIQELSKITYKEMRWYMDRIDHHGLSPVTNMADLKPKLLIDLAMSQEWLGGADFPRHAERDPSVYFDFIKMLAKDRNRTTKFYNVALRMKKDITEVMHWDLWNRRKRLDEQRGVSGDSNFIILFHASNDFYEPVRMEGTQDRWALSSQNELYASYSPIFTLDQDFYEGRPDQEGSATLDHEMVYALKVPIRLISGWSAFFHAEWGESLEQEKLDQGELFLLPGDYEVVRPVDSIIKEKGQALVENANSQPYVRDEPGWLELFTDESFPDIVVPPTILNALRENQRRIPHNIQKGRASTPEDRIDDLIAQNNFASIDVSARSTERVPKEIMAIFEIAEDESMEVVLLSGGTARDFAVATRENSKKLSFPATTDYDVVILMPKGSEDMVYNEESYRKMEERLIARLLGMGYSQEFVNRINVDFVPGTWTGDSYVFENLLKADTGNAFSISRLAVARINGVYKIIGRQDALDDLRARRLRLWIGEGVTPGALMTAKMIGKAAIYRDTAGFSVEKDAMECMKKDMADIKIQGEGAIRLFMQDIFRHMLLNDKEDKPEDRMARTIDEFGLDSIFGKTKTELISIAKSAAPALSTAEVAKPAMIPAGALARRPVLGSSKSEGGSPEGEGGKAMAADDIEILKNNIDARSEAIKKLQDEIVGMDNVMNAESEERRLMLMRQERLEMEGRLILLLADALQPMAESDDSIKNLILDTEAQNRSFNKMLERGDMWGGRLDAARANMMRNVQKLISAYRAEQLNLAQMAPEAKRIAIAIRSLGHDSEIFDIQGRVIFAQSAALNLPDSPMKVRILNIIGNMDDKAGPLTCFGLRKQLDQLIRDVRKTPALTADKAADFLRRFGEIIKGYQHIRGQVRHMKGMAELGVMKYLNQIVDTLNDVRRFAEGTPSFEAIDSEAFKAIVEEVIEAEPDRVDRPWGIDVGISFDVPVGTTVNVNRLYLKAAIYNIIKNCVDFADKSAEKKVEVKVSVAVRNGISYIEVETKDYGPGIRTDNLPDIGELGNSTRGNDRGLGLALAKLVMQDSNGLFIPESPWINAGQPDARGAKFTLCVPIGGDDVLRSPEADRIRKDPLLKNVWAALSHFAGRDTPGLAKTLKKAFNEMGTYQEEYLGELVEAKALEDNIKYCRVIELSKEKDGLVSEVDCILEVDRNKYGSNTAGEVDNLDDGIYLVEFKTQGKDDDLSKVFEQVIEHKIRNYEVNAVKMRKTGRNVKGFIFGVGGDIVRAYGIENFDMNKEEKDTSLGLLGLEIYTACIPGVIIEKNAKGIDAKDAKWIKDMISDLQSSGKIDEQDVPGYRDILESLLRREDLSRFKVQTMITGYISEIGRQKGRRITARKDQDREDWKKIFARLEAVAAVPADKTRGIVKQGVAERQALTAETISGIENGGAVVKIMVGVRQEDLNKMQNISNDLSKELARKGFGLMKSDMARQMTVRDRRQIILYVIGKDAEETKRNHDKALESIKKSLKEEVHEGDKSYIASFTMSKTDPEKIIQKDVEANITTIFISDAYTDNNLDAGSFADLMARQAIARLVAWCLAAQEDRNEELAARIFTEKLKPYLEKITANTLAGVDNLNELLKKLNEEFLKIRPIDYNRDLKMFEESQKATASSV